jgi:hypothetical protein
MSIVSPPTTCLGKEAADILARRTGLIGLAVADLKIGGERGMSGLSTRGTYPR